MFRSILSLISLLPLMAVAAQGLSSHHYRVLSEADKLLQEGKAQQASASLLPLIDADHVPLQVFQYACRAASEAELSPAVIRDCWAKAHQQHPTEKVPATQLAQQHLYQQQFAKALPLLQPWLDDDNVRYQYGYALYQLGQHQQLLSHLDKPKGQRLPASWLPLRAYSTLALERWPALLTESQRWLAQAPEQPEPWQLLAHAQIQLQQPRQAAASLEVLSMLRPQQSRQSLQQLYMQQQANNLAAECLSDQPDLNCLHQGLLAGQYQRTLEASHQLQLPPSQQDQLLLLQGRLHAALGQSQQARQQWRQVASSPLPSVEPTKLKALRQQRERNRGQALLLIGQSYWLQQLWPEAQMTYRELEQLPGFAGNATALLNNLDYYTNESSP